MPAVKTKPAASDSRRACLALTATIALATTAGSIALPGCTARDDDDAVANKSPSSEPSSAAPATSASQTATLNAVVTIPPLKSLVEPLLPAGSSVRMLMAPGRSEHGYEFTPGDLAAMGGSDLVVWVGLGLEPQVDAFIARRAAGTQVRVSFADAVGLSDPAAAGDAHAGHDHGEAGHDEHGHAHVHTDACEHAAGSDPHLWVDPVLVKQLVPNVQAAVQHALEKRGQWNAERRTALAQAAEQLLTRIDAIDATYRERLAPFKGRAMVTHHAAFARLADRYGLKVAAVIRNIEGAEPEAGKIAEVVRAIEREKASAIFIEPQFDASLARRIAAQAGVRVATLDPLGSGDWFVMMNANLDELTKAMVP